MRQGRGPARRTAINRLAAFRVRQEIERGRASRAGDAAPLPIASRAAITKRGFQSESRL